MRALIVTYPSSIDRLSMILDRMSIIVNVIARQIPASKMPSRGDCRMRWKTEAPYDFRMMWSKTILVDIHHGSLLDDQYACVPK